MGAEPGWTLWLCSRGRRVAVHSFYAVPTRGLLGGGCRMAPCSCHAAAEGAEVPEDCGSEGGGDVLEASLADPKADCWGGCLWSVNQRKQLQGLQVTAAAERAEGAALLG